MNSDFLELKKSNLSENVGDSSDDDNGLLSLAWCGNWKYDLRCRPSFSADGTRPPQNSQHDDDNSADFNYDTCADCDHYQMNISCHVHSSLQLTVNCHLVVKSFQVTTIIIDRSELCTHAPFQRWTVQENVIFELIFEENVQNTSRKNDLIVQQEI